MKVKRNIFIIAFIGLVLSICILGLGISRLVVSADTENSETQISNSQLEQDSAESAANETNNAIKEWISVVIGGIDTVISVGVLGSLVFKKKQSVAVTVNDAQTQNKLEAIHTENEKLKDALVAMLSLESGTLSILKALYADNPNLDDKIRNVINEVALNSESIIKDVKNIFNKENSEKVKQVFNAVSNIVLG